MSGAYRAAMGWIALSYMNPSLHVGINFSAQSYSIHAYARRTWFGARSEHVPVGLGPEYGLHSIKIDRVRSFDTRRSASRAVHFLVAAPSRRFQRAPPATAPHFFIFHMRASCAARRPQGAPLVRPLDWTTTKGAADDLVLPGPHLVGGGIRTSSHSWHA